MDTINELHSKSFHRALIEVDEVVCAGRKVGVGVGSLSKSTICRITGAVSSTAVLCEKKRKEKTVLQSSQSVAAAAAFLAPSFIASLESPLALTLNVRKEQQQPLKTGSSEERMPPSL